MDKDKTKSRKGKNKFLEELPWKSVDKTEEKNANRQDMQIVLGAVLFCFALVAMGILYEFWDAKDLLFIPLLAFLTVTVVILFFILFPNYEKRYYLVGTVIEKVKLKPRRRNDTTTRVDVKTDDGKILKHVLCHYPEWNQIEPHKSRVVVWRTANFEPWVREVLPDGETGGRHGEGEAGMIRVHLTDEQRMKIVHAVHPEKKAYWTYSTMDLVTGVQDKDGDSLLVKIYHLHEGIRRSGDHYSEYKFLLFKGSNVYKRECLFYTDTRQYKLLESEEACPVSGDELLEMIKFYFEDYNYLQELGILAKTQYGLDGYDALKYNDIFLEEHYFSEI